MKITLELKERRFSPVEQSANARYFDIVSYPISSKFIFNQNGLEQDIYLTEILW